MTKCLQRTAQKCFLVLLFTLGAILCGTTSRAESFTDWATSYGLSGDDALPTGNPDNDPYINALEYAFGTDPHVVDSISVVGPSLTVLSNNSVFAYRVSTQALGRK